MSEPAYFVLAALMPGPLHGYAIAKEVSKLGGGRFTLAVGTLYSVLDRLTHEAYVTVTGEEFWVSADGEIYGPERQRSWHVQPGAYRFVLPPAGQRAD